MDIAILLSACMLAATKTLISAQTFWSHVISLGLRESLTLIAFGSVCIFYGWRIFKILVVICCALIGMSAGIYIGNRMGSQNAQIWCGALGMLLAGIIAFPLTKYAVCVLGAVAGGLITGAIWFAAGLSNEFIWAGALIGFISGGMISFIVFRISVMLFTCLAGTLMIVTGLLALLHLWPESSQAVADMVLTHRWFLPAVLIVPAFGFIFLQNKLIKNGSSFSLDSPS